MGTQSKIVDMSSLTQVIEELRGWINGFLMILLAFYNLDSIHKLIRGTSLVKITQYSERGVSN